MSPAPREPASHPAIDVVRRVILAVLAVLVLAILLLSGASWASPAVCLLEASMGALLALGLSTFSVLRFRDGDRPNGTGIAIAAACLFGAAVFRLLAG